MASFPPRMKSVLQCGTRLTYQRLSQHNKEGAVNCIADTFTNPDSTEPFTWCMNLRSHHWKSMSSIFVDRAASQNLSLVAIDEDSGDVMAVMLNEDWKEPPPVAYKALTDQWRPVRAAFNEVHTRFKSTQPHIAPGQMLHTLYFSCVRPEARQQGLMTNMLNKSIQVAQDNNFSSMCADTSTDSVAKVASNLGFDPVSSLSYKEWMFDGIKIFEELPKNKSTWNELSTHVRKIPSNMYV